MPVKCFKLSKGQVLLLDNMADLDSVSVSVLFKVGSRDENNSIDGISHCIEHMNFKGTRRRSARQIAEEIDAVGGYINAYTSRERTVYCTRVLKEDLKLALDILSDITQNSVYDHEELKREKVVIAQEIGESNDNPDDLVFDKMQEVAFPHHHIGKPIAGSKESVSKIQKDDIISYNKQHYTFNNTIIGIAGNITESNLENLIENSFDNLYESTLKNTIEPKYIGGDIRVKKDIEQSYIIFGFNGASYLHKNRPLSEFAADSKMQENLETQNQSVLNILEHEKQFSSEIELRKKSSILHKDSSIQPTKQAASELELKNMFNEFYVQRVTDIIIGGGMSSKLFQNIREKLGLAYSISTFSSFHTDCGMFGVYAVTSPELSNSLIDAVIYELCNASINHAELDRAKNQVKSSILMARESSGHRVEEMINCYSIFNRIIPVEETLSKINSINIDDVQSYINKIISNAIHNQNLTFASVGNIAHMYSYDAIIDKFTKYIK